MRTDDHILVRCFYGRRLRCCRGSLNSRSIVSNINGMARDGEDALTILKAGRVGHEDRRTLPQLNQHLGSAQNS